MQIGLDIMDNPFYNLIIAWVFTQTVKLSQVFTFGTRQSSTMAIVTETEHDCFERYKLKNYEKLFNCEGCKMKGFGERYHCKICGNELHTECYKAYRDRGTTISHEYFEGEKFKFRNEPFTRIGKNNCKEYSNCCDACGKDICGFSYHCERCNSDLLPRKLDLHPCCRNLKKNLVIDDTVFNLQTKSSSKCKWCKKRTIPDGHVRGWSYVSADKDKYRFHVYCMTEMMHDACLKNGEMALEKIELRELAKSSRNRGNGANKIFKTIKMLLTITLAALMGDPTVLISSAFVELVSRGLQ